MDSDLTKASVGHSKYLYANNDLSHTQFNELYATQRTYMERIEAQAGEDFMSKKGWDRVDEVLAYRSTTYSIEDMMLSSNQRLLLLSNELVAIGVGTTSYHNTVVNLAYKAETNDNSRKPILYPYHGQKSVVLQNKLFDSNNAYEGTGLDQYSSGFILTASFTKQQTYKDVSASLVDSKGKKVDYVVKAAQYNDNQASTDWLFIPKEPLKSSETYTFKINDSLSKFTTMSQSDFNEVSYDQEYKYKKYVPERAPVITKELLDNRSAKIPTTFAKKNYSTTSVGINLNGKYINLASPARIVNGTTFIPLRGVFEEICASVVWDGYNYRVIVKKDDITIHVPIDYSYIDYNHYTSYNIKEDWKGIEVKAPSFIERGVTFVPLRVVSESLGAVVVWDSKTYTVGIGY